MPFIVFSCFFVEKMEMVSGSNERTSSSPLSLSSRTSAAVAKSSSTRNPSASYAAFWPSLSSALGARQGRLLPQVTGLPVRPAASLPPHNALVLILHQLRYQPPLLLRRGTLGRQSPSSRLPRSSSGRLGAKGAGPRGAIEASALPAVGRVGVRLQRGVAGTFRKAYARLASRLLTTAIGPETALRFAPSCFRRRQRRRAGAGDLSRRERLGGGAMAAPWAGSPGQGAA